MQLRGQGAEGGLQKWWPKRLLVREAVGGQGVAVTKRLMGRYRVGHSMLSPPKGVGFPCFRRMPRVPRKGRMVHARRQQVPSSVEGTIRGTRFLEEQSHRRALP